MESETEKELLEEVKKLRESVESLEKRKETSVVEDLLDLIVQPLLIGIFIVGPIGAVLLVLFDFVFNY